MGVTNQEGHFVTDRKRQWVSAALRASYRQNSYVAKNKTNGRYCKEQMMMVCWQPLTFAQILAALTMGKRESAFGLTVTSMPGNSLESFSSYFSAGPTVSTNTCRTPERWRSVKKLKAEWKWHNRGRGHYNAELHQISALPAIQCANMEDHTDTGGEDRWSKTWSVQNGRCPVHLRNAKVHIFLWSLALLRYYNACSFGEAWNLHDWLPAKGYHEEMFSWPTMSKNNGQCGQLGEVLLNDGLNNTQ